MVRLHCLMFLPIVLSIAGCASTEPTTFAAKPGKPILLETRAPAGTVTGPSGRTYRFYGTADAGAQRETERDELVVAQIIRPLRLEEKPKPADWFKGKKRASAKTSIVHGRAKRYRSVTALLADLPSDDEMQNYDPPLGSKSERSEAESRNVGVCALMIAAKREDDADYHAILTDGEDTFFNAEVSALPKDGDDETNERLLRVRRTFENFVKEAGRSVKSYSEWDPVPVYVEGSLFYDIDHKPGGVGPAFARPDTSWEIHPITKLVWEPGAECGN